MLWLWFGRLTRWTLAGVFLYARITKAMDPASLAVQIKNYHLAPWWLVHPLAITLPWLEIAAGLLCLAGVWLVESVIILSTLLLIFMIGSAWAIYWQLDNECGCFAGHAKAGWVTISRDLVLLALAIVVLQARGAASARALNPDAHQAPPATSPAAPASTAAGRHLAA